MREILGPFLTANLAVLEELLTPLVALVAPLGDEALNWTPNPDGANSIAAIVTHVVGSLDNWLARAVGEPVQRDRDSEFLAHHSADELVAALAGALATARRRFELLNGIDPATVRTVLRLSSQTVVDVTVAWCVEHAVIHTGEHWGQVQLTDQLYQQNRCGMSP